MTTNTMMAASGSAEGGASSSRGSLRELAGCLRVLDIMADELRPDIQMQTVRMFLTIAVQGDVSSQELIRASGVEASSVSRNIDLLGTGPHLKPGAGWIESYDDPMDRRQKRCKLTSAGASVARKMHAQVMRYFKDRA